MRKVVFALTLAIILVAVSIPVAANDEKVSLKNDLIIVQNTNLVPLRKLADSLGASTTWDASTQTIGISNGEYKITLTIGSTKAFYNGVAEGVKS
ncbi:stalk domain-containing protein [Paenibacillus macerans]|uniref:stalk domain-containing protein n=1 Tax=Paenibacillus macerans TaxID=44252 RepID=UPI003D310C5F